MLKDNFPIFKNNLIYLDNAATTQKPRILSEALAYYYENFNSNIGRSAYHLAHLSERAYEDSRQRIAQFFNARSECVTFTLGATHSLNLAAHILAEKIPDNSKILLSIFEHHANLLPWQELAKKKNLQLVYVETDEQLAKPESLEEDFFNDICVIALPHITNTTGQIIPVEKWISIAKARGIFTVIDGSQAVSSLSVDISALGADFYAFSAHKLYGPMGLGILVINQKIIKTAKPLFLGGGIIEDVSRDNHELIEDIRKFEAGTPNVANIYAFAQTLDWLQSIDWLDYMRQVKTLNNILKTKMKKLNYIEPIVKTQELDTTNIFSFNIKGIHAHDVGTFLDEKGICVRVGKHCAYPLHEHLHINSSVRVSWGIYNTQEDLDSLVAAIEQCFEFFN